MFKKNTLMIMALITTVITFGLHAAEISSEKKTEFYKLTRQRNSMWLQLDKLDKKAAELVKHEQDTTAVNAEQAAMQDRLDLIQFRIETMATRYDLPIPDLPTNETTNEDDSKYDYVFAYGQERTKAELHRQTLHMLASINYYTFIAGAE
ncbi:MAG: hypothetical protein JEZ07_14390 [Phycisphaerae bacterium]|nr:hypothetical protein [Phycisphaerae bacterium]